MTTEYDVVIVGAGPAGVSAAIYCANQGLNVILLDKKKKEDIGDKVCGEALSHKTVIEISKLLDVEPPKASEINTEVKELVLKTKEKLELTFPAIGYMINRKKYGQRLLREALSRGTKLLDFHKVIKPIIKKGKVAGVIARDKKNNTEVEIRGKMVIDASGAKAIIRTNLPKDFAPYLYQDLKKSDYASCYREIIELNDQHSLNGKIVLQYEKDIPEPGYIWFFGDGGHKLNCGTGYVKVGENASKSVKKVYFQVFHRYYPKGEYRTIDGRGAIVPVKPPLWNAVAPGLIIAGDAAFHANPLTAEGHGPALYAGTFAGMVATKAIILNRFGIDTLWEYNQKIVEKFGAEHARDRILAMVLTKIGAEKLRYLLKKRVIEQEDLTTVGILKKRSLKDTLKKLIRGLPKIGLLLEIKKAIEISKEIDQHCKNFPSNIEGLREWEKKLELLYKKIR